jgi:GNAT superfamily N-acetyltransferase
MNMNILEQTERSIEPKTISVEPDSFTDIASKAFDYEFSGTSKFHPWEMPTKIPKDFNIGLIVGSSGSGKSTLLDDFGKEEDVSWEYYEAIVSHFSTPEEAVNKLTAVGLNNIPSWTRPFHVLSTGEKFRAELARKVKDGAVIDEFTSVVNRQVAKATSTAISKHIKKNNIKGVVFASCHDDIVEWLEPDWVFDTNSGTLYDGRSLRRPKIEIEIYPCKREIWGMFSQHHYLTESINNSCRSYVAVWDGEIIGFTSCITMPSGTLKNAWRGHRTVILPDYQGMGIGTRLTDAIAQVYIDQGKRYYSRTAHPRFGYYRDNSPLWRATAKSRKQRKSKATGFSDYVADMSRVCFSHEYIGQAK